MKIKALLIILATLGLGVAGWMYSAQQQATMKLVIGATGGTDGTAGLKAVNQTLDGRMAALSGERKKALEASDEAHTLMQRSAEELSEAEAELGRQVAARDEMAERLEDAKKRQVEIQAEVDALLAFFRSLPAPEMANVSDLTEAVTRFEETVNTEKERSQTLTQDLEEKTTVREAAVKKVSDETTELARLDGINRRFEEEYRKNDDEFTIMAIDTRFRFVVFSAGKDSGLVASDAAPLLVKRNGEMIAKLRVLSIQSGRQIQRQTMGRVEQVVCTISAAAAFRSRAIPHHAEGALQ